MGGVGRVIVETGTDLPDWDWNWECENLRPAWPYIAPTWLRAAEPAMAEGRPFHITARRLREESALLPGYVYDSPPDIDFDPRTYLGWQPKADVHACCGGGDAAESSIDRIQALGEEAFFPALILGSPLGYRSEVAFTFWTPDLYRVMIKEAVREATAQGVRSIVAPWIPDRAGNQHLIQTFRDQGAATGFYGTEDYLALTADNYDAHIAAMPARRRRRLRLDRELAEGTGVKFDRLDRDELAASVPRIAELTLMNRERYGATDRRLHVEGLLTGLLASGADVRCWVARKDDQIAGVCVGVRKLDRIYIKWVGFDYTMLGERSGVYFVLMFDEPVADAYTEGVRFVEFGMGSHEAKVMRGCESRRFTSAFIATDPDMRPAVTELLAEYSAKREALFGAQPAS